jgi:hypothetical protein
MPIDYGELRINRAIAKIDRAVFIIQVMRTCKRHRTKNELITRMSLERCSKMVKPIPKEDVERVLNNYYRKLKIAA